jgi:hypothetical protein
MILILLAFAALASVPLFGGDLRRFAQVQLRWLWLAPAALAVQVLIFNVLPGGSHTAHALVHLGTYALLGLFIWGNRRLPGAWLLALGCASNLAAILANAGVMPQAVAAHKLSGVFTRRGFDNSAIVSHPRLLWLGDVIPVPAPFGLANVMSVGDCLLIVGLVVVLHSVSGSFRHRAAAAAPAPAAMLALPAPAVNPAYVDAVLAGALSTVHAALHLWRSGASAASIDGRRALAAFTTCRRAADRLPSADERVRRAQRALAWTAVQFGDWQAARAIGRDREQTLLAATGALGPANDPAAA